MTVLTGGHDHKARVELGHDRQDYPLESFDVFAISGAGRHRQVDREALPSPVPTSSIQPVPG